MLYVILVFGHLLATSMALGAIVATDLRMLSKLAQDRVRIPPPNEFVARLVSVALVMLWATGAGMVVMGLRNNPDFLTPKIQAKILLVMLLTANAFVLHRWTFPRLARGRSVGRWRLREWIVVAMPVALSNALWMFCAFLGVARPWNATMSVRDVLHVAAWLYLFAFVVVCVVLAAAGWQEPRGRLGAGVIVMKRWLASIGALGRQLHPGHDTQPQRSRSTQPPLTRPQATQPPITRPLATRSPATLPVLDAEVPVVAARDGRSSVVPLHGPWPGLQAPSRRRA
jgi:hypothetical protein